MVDGSQIKEHVEVVGSDSAHVGTVDHMDGSDRIKLTKRDSDAHGQHHYIPLAWVETADENKVVLNKTSSEAEQQWASE